MLGFGQATTGLSSVQDFVFFKVWSQRTYLNSSIAEFSGWWWWWYLFFFSFFFLSSLWTAMKRSTLDLLRGQEHQRPQCFLTTRKAELPNYGLLQRAFLSISKLTNQSPVFTCYGVVKLSLFLLLFFCLFFFSFSILKHIIIFYKQKYVALFTKHSGFHKTVQSSWFAHFLDL